MKPFRRGLLFHFTHIDNLPSIVEHGLRSDSLVIAEDSLAVEVGKDNIKAARRHRTVPIPPGGVVADYVPFYFAPRSPMLFTIDKGNVPSYQDGQDPLVYLVTDCDQVRAANCSAVFTDRNAYWAYAHYYDEIDRVSEIVDWDLMEARFWNNTEAEPDRMERRMAEFLVHERVPFSAVLGVAVRTEAMRARVEELLEPLTDPPKLAVRRDWYY